MNLNGGYIMLDLDDTSNLLARVQAVFASGKPLIIKKDDKMQFADYSRESGTSGDYIITISNNTRYSIHQFAGTLSEQAVVPIYTHYVAVTGTMGVSRTIMLEYKSIRETPETSALAVFQKALIARNYNSAPSSVLVSDSVSQFANVYITVSGSTTKLYIKTNGATQWTEVTNFNAFTIDDKASTI